MPRTKLPGGADRLALLHRILRDVVCAGPDECWAWTGSCNAAYGVVAWAGRNRLVHRLVYEAFNGPIVGKLDVDHLCGNKRCCNPTHLDLVSRAHNVRRAGAHERAYCKRGHPLSGANLMLYSQRGVVYRKCRACYNAVARESARRRRFLKGQPRVPMMRHVEPVVFEPDMRELPADAVALGGAGAMQ